MANHSSEKGFTLIEIMVVIVILVITIAVVFPVSYRMVEKFDRYIARHQAAQDLKQEKYMNFITDQIN